MMHVALFVCEVEGPGCTNPDYVVLFDSEMVQSEVEELYGAPGYRLDSLAWYEQVGGAQAQCLPLETPLRA